MSRDITDGLRTIWSTVQGSTWYTGLTLSADSTAFDLRPKYEYHAGSGATPVDITWADGSTLIDNALHRGINDPTLIKAFGEGLRGSVADPMEGGYSSAEGLMLTAGWAFNSAAPSAFTGATTAFGALAETGKAPLASNATQCEAAFYALLEVAYAAHGLTWRTSYTQNEDAIYNLGGADMAIKAQASTMAGAGAIGRSATGTLAADAGALAGEGTVTTP